MVVCGFVEIGFPYNFIWVGGVSPLLDVKPVNILRTSSVTFTYNYCGSCNRLVGSGRCEPWWWWPGVAGDCPAKTQEVRVRSPRCKCFKIICSKFYLGLIPHFLSKMCLNPIPVTTDLNVFNRALYHRELRTPRPIVPTIKYWLWKLTEFDCNASWILYVFCKYFWAAKCSIL